MGFIALIAYFEAFCKNQFAALVNICPQLVVRLSEQGYDVTVDATDILLYPEFVHHRLGFLVTEHANFGKAKEVNSHYRKLLQISPFSKDEQRRFEQLSNDRNLLVHHGGIYTLRYAKEKLDPAIRADNAFYHSLVVDAEFFDDAARFLELIVTKTVQSTKIALQGYVENNGIELTSEAQAALDNLDTDLERD